MPISVKVRDDESLERALRRFRRLCYSTGLRHDILNQGFYDKPSIKKRKKKRRWERYRRRHLLNKQHDQVIHSRKR